MNSWLVLMLAGAVALADQSQANEEHSVDKRSAEPFYGYSSLYPGYHLPLVHYSPAISHHPYGAVSYVGNRAHGIGKREASPHGITYGHSLGVAHHPHGVSFVAPRAHDNIAHHPFHFIKKRSPGYGLGYGIGYGLGYGLGYYHPSHAVTHSDIHHPFGFYRGNAIHHPGVGHSYQRHSQVVLH